LGDDETRESVFGRFCGQLEDEGKATFVHPDTGLCTRFVLAQGCGYSLNVYTLREHERIQLNRRAARSQMGGQGG
jgi:hypothetical protein